MNQNVPMFLQARANARAAGDHNLARSIDADLQRLGHVDSVERIQTPDGMETTAVRVPKPAPKRRTGRPPKPRCRHGEIAEHCEQCQAKAQRSR